MTTFIDTMILIYSSNDIKYKENMSVDIYACHFFYISCNNANTYFICIRYYEIFITLLNNIY